MVLKRVVDISLSSLFLVLLFPVLAMVALAVWFESGSPVFFLQERVGLKFRHFQIIKFRTMRTQNVGPPVTVAGDSRITPVGRFLRLSKLDEVPQFWNVLCGDMSLVGPRPEVPQYVEVFKDRYTSILTVRPGITDLASIRFRSEEQTLAEAVDPLKEYLERVLPAKLNLAENYVHSRSFLRDLSILIRTAIVTLRGI